MRSGSTAVRMPSSGVSIIAAAHAGSEFVTADAARGTVTRSRRSPRATPRRRSRHPCSTCSPDASRTRHPGRRASRMTPRRRHDAPLGWFGWFGYELGARLNDVRGVARRDPGCRVPLRRPGHRVRPRRAHGAARVARARRRERRRRGAVGRGARVGARGGARGIRGGSPTRCRPPRRRPTPASPRHLAARRPSGTPRSSPLPGRDPRGRRLPAVPHDPRRRRRRPRPRVDATSRCASRAPATTAASSASATSRCQRAPGAIPRGRADGVVRTQPDQGHAPARRRPGARRRAARASCARARRSAPRTS